MKAMFTPKWMAAFAAIAITATAFAQQAPSCNWRYFLSDNPASGNVSNIYEVNLDEATMEANLTLLTTVNYRSHIAYDGEKQLLYIVRNPGGAFQTLDVSVPGNMPAAPIALSMNIGGSPAAGVDANGDLYIGSDTQNKIYKVDPTTGMATFHADAPVQGGDLDFDASGQLYLATRANGGQVWKINPGASNTLFSSIPADVTGGAFKENGSGLISLNNRSRLYSSPTLSFNPSSFYKLRLGGAVFTTSAGGDLAAGCTTADDGIELCEDFRTYLMDKIGNSTAPSNLFAVSFTGGAAELSQLATFDYNAHMAYNELEDVLYVVNINGEYFDVFDLSLNAVVAQVAISPALGSTPAAVFNAADGLLYLGDEQANKIYKVNVNDGTSEFVANCPVSGGDLVLLDGELYLFERTGNTLRKIVGDSNVLIAAGLPANVAGAAATIDGKFITQNQFQTAFNVFDTNGNLTGTIPVTLGGASYTLNNGDLASGCATTRPPSGCDLKIYYTGYPTIGGVNELFSVEITNGDAVFTKINGFSTADNHIGLSSDELIYSVRGSVIDIFNPITESYVEQNIPIKSASGQTLSGISSAAMDSNDKFWLAVNATNTVYSIEFIGGEAIGTVEFTGTPINGGDIVFVQDADGADVLLHMNRSNNTLYNFNEGTSVVIALTDINGVGVLGDGRLLFANGISGADGGLWAYDLQTAALEQFNNIGGPNVFFYGDMASVCLPLDPNPVGCLDYQTYYTGYPTTNANSGNELFRVDVNDGEATFTKVNGFKTTDNHIALSSDGLIYAVSVNRTTLDIFDPAAESYVQQDIPIKSTSGQLLTDFPAAAMDRNDKLWLARASNNTVYSVEFIGGEAIATVEFTGTPISGGDLIWTFGEDETGAADVLWHINRSNNTLYNFNDGSSVVIALPEINGASVLEDGRLLFANGQAGAAGGLYAYDVAEGTLEQLTSIGGPNVFFNGDLAGGCVTAEPAFTPQTNINTPRIVTDASTRLQNFPNPTQGISTVVFEAASEERIILQVLDMTGREITTLFNQVTQPGMEYRIQYDAGNLPTGLYMYRLNTGTEVKVSKFMVGR